jgi:hypothetical protein
MLSFKQLDKSRLFAILVDKDEKFKENLFINEHRAKKLVQDEDFKKRISDYAEEVEVNENGIVTSFILKDDYKLVPTPPNFGEKENQRMVFI